MSPAPAKVVDQYGAVPTDPKELRDYVLRIIRDEAARALPPKTEYVVVNVMSTPATSRWFQKNWRMPIAPAVIDQLGIPASCGTAMCFAGWAVHVHPDYEWQVPADKLVIDSVGWTDTVTQTLDPYADQVVGPDGDVQSASAAAREVLGLSYDQGMVLFDARNNLDAIEALLEAINDGVTEYTALSAVQQQILYPRVDDDED